MVALTATSWVVTTSDVKVFRHTPYKRVARISLPTAGEYPSDGIPIPTAAKLGLRVLNYIVPISAITTPTGVDESIVNYDNTTRTIRLFHLSTTSDAAQAWAEMATTVIPGAAAIYVEVIGH